MFQDMPNQYPMAELQKMIPEDLAKIIDYYAVVIRILRKRLHYEGTSPTAVQVSYP